MAWIVKAVPASLNCLKDVIPDTCQSLIIEFIKEFKLQVCTAGKPLSAIHLACFLKLHIVLKYLVEQCQVYVNQPICDCKADVHSDTALLIMSSIGDKEIVQHLTEHGTDPSKIYRCGDGKKPQEYMMFGGQRIRDTTNVYSKSSAVLIKHSKIYRNLVSKELHHYQTLCNSGVSECEAVNPTLKKFPKLNKEVTSTKPLDLKTIPNHEQAQPCH